MTFVPSSVSIDNWRQPGNFRVFSITEMGRRSLLNPVFHNWQTKVLDCFICCYQMQMVQETVGIFAKTRCKHEQQKHCDHADCRRKSMGLASR